MIGHVCLPATMFAGVHACMCASGWVDGWAGWHRGWQAGGQVDGQVGGQAGRLFLDILVNI